MTALEMQLKFNQTLSNHLKIDLDIKTIDIEYYLNQSQKKLVDSLYDIYEYNERARKALANITYNVDLTRTSVSATQTGVHPNGEYWDLPTLMLYTLNEEATINVNSCGEASVVPSAYQRVIVKPVNLDYYNRHLQDPFKKPYDKLIWRLDITNGDDKLHELVTDGSQVYKYHIAYLKTPVDISIANVVTSELMEWIHQDIVDGAVDIALKTMQLNKQLNK